MTRIVLATCSEYQQLAPSDRVYREALQRLGVVADVGIWTDGLVAFRGADLVVLRATWDYHQRMDEYRVWLAALQKASIAVANPVPLVLWNLEKTYLDNLALDGIATPAQRVADCSPAAVHRVLAEMDWKQAVLKPLSGASGHGVRLIQVSTLNQTWPQIAAEIAGARVVLQEFIPEIRDNGQISYVFIDGRFAHAVRMLPRDQEFRINSRFMPRIEVDNPSNERIAAASRVMARLPQAPLYARIDMVPRADHQVLLEAEVNEPALFFHIVPDSAEMLAQATLRWLSRHRHR